MTWTQDLALAERYALDLARINKERSWAVESKYYGRGGDPANYVEFEAEIQRRAVKQRKGK